MEKLWRCPIRGENWFLSVPAGLRAVEHISIHALREEGDRSASVDNRRRADFYPRPPRGGRPRTQAAAPRPAYFYPRPPRGGRRPELQCCCTKRRIFLSTPSARRATLCLVVTFHFRDISIHALREEGDTLQSKSTERLFDFYPRPPRGGRRAQASKSRQRASISIHALREEGDLRYGKPARAI